MKAAIVVLREHSKFVFEELASIQKKLVDVEKTRDYHLADIARKQTEYSEVNAAIAKLEAL